MEIRSFTDYLRSLDDAGLSELFAARPDLVSPVPPDLASLAVRASSSHSIARAIDSLTEFEFQILEACVAMDEEFTLKNLISITHKDAAVAVVRLITFGLVYPTEKGLRLPTSVSQLLINEPAGLGPASLAKLKLAELNEAPDAAKRVLTQLIWGPPRGSVGDIKNPGPGIAWLLDRKFLVPLDQRTVIMPREVGIYLRGGKVHKSYESNAPAVTGAKRVEKSVNMAAAANVSTVLGWVEELLHFWAQEPADALRSGGLGVRDLKEISTHIGIDENCAAFIAEISYLAGLLTIDGDDRILPSNNFDIWLSQSAETRWRTLAANWLNTSRVSGLVGRGEAKSVAALGPELDRVNAASTRKLVINLLNEQPNLAPDLDSFTRTIKWLAPSKRNPGIQAELIQWTLREAEWLGFTGQGASAKYGRAFMAGADALGIDEDLPKPVDHILIQSDNTAIAPGPLEHDIARELSAVADIESRGGATVYRFSEASIRRGLDHGKSGEEIRTFLVKTSKTPMPQPLEYLIADVAKKHGKLRVGNTASFIRCEDTSLITQIMSDKRLDVLSLRKIAPEVLICDLDATDAMNVLRNAGYLPAAEASNGALITGHRSHRAKAKPKPPRVIGEIDTPTEATLAAAVRSIRAGEKSSHKQSKIRNLAANALGSLPRTSANETMDLLAIYVEKQQALSIGYADNNGAVSHRIVDPIKISAGSLVARDHATGEMQSFRIPRITGVAPL